MAYRSLINILAFLLGLLFSIWAGIASAAAPETWYAITDTYGTSVIMTPALANCDNIRKKTKGEIETAFANCIPPSVVSGASTYTKNGGTTVCPGGALNTCRYMYDRFNADNGTTTTNAAYVAGQLSTIQSCWDGTDPVGGICPDQPDCTATQGQTKNWTAPGTMPSSVCLSNCRWDVGTGIYLPTANLWYASVTSAGQICIGSTTGTPPVALPQPIFDPAPVTTTETDATPPVTNGDTTTQTSTETTTTTPSNNLTSTSTDVTNISLGNHTITKTTTTTTTTHPDGSTTTTVSTDYSEAVPSKTTIKLPASGAPSSSTTPGKTLTGNTTTTTNTNPDGSSSSSTVNSGVGGDGASGPEGGEGTGGEGDCVGADCGDGDPCGEFVPQQICDWFDEPELNQTPVALPEITSAPAPYDSGLGAGSCPSNISISLGTFGTHTMSIQPICDFALAIRPLVISVAYLMAAFIVVGGRGK